MLSSVLPSFLSPLPSGPQIMRRHAHQDVIVWTNKVSSCSKSRRNSSEMFKESFKDSNSSAKLFSSPVEKRHDNERKWRKVLILFRSTATSDDESAGRAQNKQTRRKKTLEESSMNYRCERVESTRQSHKTLAEWFIGDQLINLICCSVVFMQKQARFGFGSLGAFEQFLSISTIKD
jgi:hypothetical protein